MRSASGQFLRISVAALKGEGDGSGSPAVRLWGSGAPRREFLHVEDMAAACVFVMQLSDEAYASGCRQPDGTQVSHLNIGWGEDASIRELSEFVRAVVGYTGKVEWDSGKPDGMPRKLLDVSRLNRLGWRPQIGLEAGIRSVYEWYCSTPVGREKG